MPSKTEESTLHLSRVLLVGNPNAGKTSLFNALTGLRAKTANYPGVTVDVRKATLEVRGRAIELTDLPGLYGMNALSPDEELTAAVLRWESPATVPPDLVVVGAEPKRLHPNRFATRSAIALKRAPAGAVNLVGAPLRA